MRASILSLGLLVCLIGCGQDDDDAPPTPPVMEVPDQHIPDQAEDMAADTDADQVQDLADLPPRPPEVLSFTFWRRDDACPINNCVTAFRVGVRAGTFERLRGGVGLGPIRLTDEEQRRARALIDTEDVRSTMKVEGGWGCPEPAPDSNPTYGFEAAVFESGRERMWYHSVTGCVQSAQEEPADRLIAFVRELQLRYYPER
jgi:hypothetical protein